jgi:hypothetical protein
MASEKYQIVDIRDKREIEREGKIPGAYHAPRGMLEFWVDPTSPYHKSVFSEGATIGILKLTSFQTKPLCSTALMGGGRCYLLMFCQTRWVFLAR